MVRRRNGHKTLRNRENNEICKNDNRMHCLKTGFGRVYGPVERHWWNADSHSFVELELLQSNRAT